MGTPPTVYLLHGDDEHGIAQFIQNKLLARLGEESNAQMNTTRLEGGRFTFGELENAVRASPFLAARRVVILQNPLVHLKRKEEQRKFTALLEQIPPTTALVIAETRLLKGSHWLLKWARSREGMVMVRAVQLPKGAALAAWIRARAKEQGGKFTPEAAAYLATLVADDTRRAANEVDKLLAYVNFSRAVEVDDVAALTPAADQGDVFKMVDAIGNRNGKVALEMLHQLLAEREPLSLFGMIVRQFRLLLLTKEMQAANTPPQQMAAALKTRDFVVRKLLGQARNFDLATLEAIYERLAEIDEEIKTGKVEAEIALDTLIAGLAG